MRGKILNISLVTIGFILSPITWWNDPFVNIPLSYLASILIAHFFPKAFTISFIVSYWLTNILGFVLMEWGGKNLTTSSKMSRKNHIITITIYTVILLILSIYGIIKPLPLK